MHTLSSLEVDKKTLYVYTHTHKDNFDMFMAYRYIR